jgi:hypothetical protein
VTRFGEVDLQLFNIASPITSLFGFLWPTVGVSKRHFKPLTAPFIVGEWDFAQNLDSNIDFAMSPFVVERSGTINGMLLWVDVMLDEHTVIKAPPPLEARPLTHEHHPTTYCLFHLPPTPVQSGQRPELVGRRSLEQCGRV